MAKTVLDEQEVEIVREQFRDFLSGRAVGDNVMIAASEAHTDCHNDVHTDHATLPL
jgi:hypothetical protein